MRFINDDDTIFRQYLIGFGERNQRAISDDVDA
jgi:hypothetical protein